MSTHVTVVAHCSDQLESLAPLVTAHTSLLMVYVILFHFFLLL